MVWKQLEIDKAHIAYAVIAVFTAVFSLISLFVKSKLYIGEATVSSVYGLIVGPHCLNWFAPTTWGNSDYITLELSRIALVVQIFAVAVELPKKYMLRHWRSVVMLLVPVMTAGWLIVGAFMYLVIPGFNFSDALVVSACITATDPVLAAAVVGKGKFAQRVPGHLRNILSAESGCNDGMAFPFIYLGLNLVMHSGKGGEIVKDWICLSILYECLFGCLLGIVIGYIGRHAIKYAEGHGLIDRESFLAFYIVLALMSAGFGSMLGVDDLLVSFAAGATFAWDGWFARKTEESHVSTVIDLLLNMSYFVYFGAIIPWEQFNNHEIGTDVWRLVILSIVVLFLRRIPAVLLFKPFIPDIKTWREALFCGHFGPIGVGAIFASILARKELESLDTNEETPLRELPSKNSEHYQLIASIWPIVTFIIISSIIVHGSSVAVTTLGRHLNSMAISMSFTTTNTTNTTGGGTTWLNRLPKLETNGRSFSLQRVDTKAPGGLKKLKKPKRKHDTTAPEEQNLEKQDAVGGDMSRTNTVETSGIKYRPAGGMDKRKRRNRRRNRLSRAQSRQEYLNRNRPEPEQFDLTKLHKQRHQPEDQAEDTTAATSAGDPEKLEKSSEEPSSSTTETMEKPDEQHGHPDKHPEEEDVNVEPFKAYGEGKKIIIEDRHGEVIDTLEYRNGKFEHHREEGVPDYLDGPESEGEAEHEKQEDDERVRGAVKAQAEKDARTKGKAVKDEEREQKEDNDSINLSRRSSSVLSKVGSVGSKASAKAIPLIRTNSRRTKKAYAYKVNNYLVIENEDGEVIRRYEIHQHETPRADNAAGPASRDDGYVTSSTRPRSNSLMGKTLSAVGLKKLTSAGMQAPEPATASHMKATQQIASDLDAQLAEEEEEEQHDGLRMSSGEDSDGSEELDESEHDEETEVEKKRRLAALSKNPLPRDESDEEVSPPANVAK